MNTDNIKATGKVRKGKSVIVISSVKPQQFGRRCNLVVKASGSGVECPGFESYRTMA